MSVNTRDHFSNSEIEENDQAMGSSDFILVNEDNESKKKMNIKELISKFGPKAKNKIRRSCTRKLLFKKFPVLNWLPKYTVPDGVGDLVAGITVGLTMIPQALAYANIAQLPPQYGLYSGFFGSLLYIVFGTCKDVSMGPTAIASLMTAQFVQGKGPEYAILLCFLSGLVMLIMGILGLGFILDFVSGPVSSGFTSAVAIIIVTSQVKDLLGIPATGNTFVEMWTSIFEEIHKIRLWDTLLGAICIVVLLLLRYMGTLNIGLKEDNLKTTAQKIFNKVIWLISVLRNAILVFVTGGIAYAFSTAGQEPFKLIGDVPAGLPEFQAPPFGYKDENGIIISFSDMLSTLGAGIIVVPILAILEDTSVCKAFSGGKAVDSTQEMIAMGVCNIGNSFVQGYPGTGALARSAVFNASGVRTSLGNIVSGLLVIISLILFTELFFYIPKAALAAIIVAAVIFMVEVRVIRPMWRCKKIDLIPCLATFISCLAIRIEIGILIGVGINIIFILHQAARPRISIKTMASNEGIEYLLLTPDRCLIFPSVDYVRKLVTKQGTKEGLIPVVIDCSYIYGADFTAAGVIRNMTQDFASRNQPLFFYNLKSSVVQIFEGLQPEQFICYYDENVLDMLIKNRKPPV